MVRTSIEDRRTALVAAALRVVAARGLGEASVRAIVAEAGMSVASFHYAFASRDQLLDLLITEALAKERSAVIPTRPADRTLRALIADGLTGYLEHLQANPLHEQAMLELTQFALRSRPALARDQYDAYARIAVAALEVAAAHTDQRWRVPLPIVAKLLIVVTDGLTLSWLVERDDATARALVAAAAEAIGALTEPEPAS